MSDAKVEVEFSANIGGAASGMDLLKQRMQQLNAEAKALAASITLSGSAASASQTSAMKAIKTEYDSISSTLSTAAHGFQEVAHGAHGAGTGFGFYARELHALIDETTSGRLRQAQGTFTNLAFTFLQGHTALIPYIAGFAALAAALGFTVYELVSTQNAIDRLGASAEKGQFKTTADESLRLRDQFAQLAAVSKSAAVSILSDFDDLGAGGRELATALIPIARAMAQAEGIEFEKAMEKLKADFEANGKAGEAYLSTQQRVTASEKLRYQTLIALGQAGAAGRIVFNALSSQYEATAQKEVAATAQHKAQSDAVYTMLGATEGAADRMAALANVEGDVAAAVNKSSGAFDENARKAFEMMDANDVASAHLRADADKIADGVDKIGSSGRKMQNEMKTLTMALAGALGDPAEVDRLGEAIRLKQQEIQENAQKASDPGGRGRDMAQQVEEQIRTIEASQKGATVRRVQDEINAEQTIMQSRNATDAQRATAADRLVDLNKRMRDAQEASDKAADELAIARAGKNQAEIVAIRQGAVAREGNRYGPGSDQQREAIQQLAAAEKTASDQSSADAKQKIGEQIDDAQEAARRRTQIDQDDYSHKRLTTAAYLADVRSALNQEISAVQQGYAREIALGNQTQAEKDGLRRQEVKAVERIQDEISAAERKAADDTQKSWEDAASTVEGAWNSQLRGLLAGTTGWGTAMKNITADLVIKMIEEAEKMAVNWVIQESLKTTATTTGAAARTAAENASSAAGAVSWVADAVKAIEAFGAQTFAGVTAFMAPIAGPAAPAFGAAAEASVLAAGAVASADIGMWNVPHDQLAMIHHNELIMPSAEAGAFRDMLSSGAASGDGGAGGRIAITPTVNIHTSAIDGASVGQFWRNNQRGMMKAVDEAVRHGAHLGLRAIKQ